MSLALAAEAQAEPEVGSFLQEHQSASCRRRLREARFSGIASHGFFVLSSSGQSRGSSDIGSSVSMR